MGLLLRKQLDAMAHRGCQMPDCDHSSHEPIIFFHARCHLHAQCDAHYAKFVEPNEGDRLFVHCAQCDKYICNVAVKEAKPIKRCHITAPLEVCYREGSGVLKIICNQCKAEIVELEVAE